MHRARLILLSVLIILFAASCETTSDREERLSRQYCGSCHLFTEASLLDKQTWAAKVLPQMAFRMGFSNYDIMANISPSDLPRVMEAIPSQPMVTQEEWEAITHYFISRSADSLSIPERKITRQLSQFDVSPSRSFKAPFITMIRFDTISGHFAIGNRASKLYKVDPLWRITDSLQLSSPPSYIEFEKDRATISLMGIMDPNDQSKGELVQWSQSSGMVSTILDSIQRPVHFATSDFDLDGDSDIVVCAFGNYTGGLLLFENKDNGYVTHALNSMPGARKVVLRDFDKDGLTDILVLMTQGDERLVLYTNKGALAFEEKTLMRFPPVYGSNYFELADFNQDGFDDIVYVNGDNGDYSIILKPYHGVRILENDGHNNFREAWSFRIAGASQSVARDFDKDGDLDIAVMAFFPDFKKHPEESFVYLENQGKYQFTPQVTPLAVTGRWLVMESGDFDLDGDDDIVLGSANFKGLGLGGGPDWPKGQGSLLIFTNTLVEKPVVGRQ